MVDWDQVERLRSKGWDWARIAGDERVEFTAEAAGGDAGRQLRTLYYQRRSRAQRRGPEGSATGSGKAADDKTKPPILLRIGYVAAPLLGLWVLLAYVLPWPALIVPFLDVLFVFIIVLFIFLFSLFRAERRWETALRGPLVVGIILGLVIPGGLSLVALQEGCPTLQHSAVAGEPNGWDRYANAEWTQNGAPVFFFYGSIACPYCSASSWSMTYALKAFGILTGTVLTHGSPTDTAGNPGPVPEVNLAGASLQSPYVALQVYEGTDDNQITLPTLPTCTYQAYFTTYDTGGTIPFVVIGGQYVHAGASLCDPTALVDASGQHISPQVAQQQMQNQSGATWTACSPAMYTIEAILVKLNNGQPAAVAHDPNVAAILSQLK